MWLGWRLHYHWIWNRMRTPLVGNKQSNQTRNSLFCTPSLVWRLGRRTSAEEDPSAPPLTFQPSASRRPSATLDTTTACVRCGSGLTEHGFVSMSDMTQGYRALLSLQSLQRRSAALVHCDVMCNATPRRCNSTTQGLVLVIIFILFVFTWGSCQVGKETLTLITKPPERLCSLCNRCQL